MSFTTDVRRHVLANGLTVVVQPTATAPVVAVVTHVRAGYFDEPDPWVGISHVLEHMYFKGTARRGPGDIARETQAVGGYINAGTIYDKTVYHTVLPAAGDGLERAIDLQADALVNAALDPDELRRELEVIVQEAKRKQDSPSAVATESLYELLFRVHRMRRWRIGTEEGLRRLTATDVRAYYESRYAPERVIVGVAGDVDGDRALGLAGRAFGGWRRPSGPVEGSPREPDGPVSPRARVVLGDVKRALASIGWRTVGTLHPDAAPLDVAAELLGAGRAARLYRALRTPGLAARAGASHYTPTEVGVFEIALESDTPRLDAALERALDVVADLAERGPDAGELERVRGLIATGWARRFERAEGRAAALCAAEALGGYALLDELYRRAMAVTAADVRRVTAAYLAPDTASAVLSLPEGGGSRHAETWPPPARVRRACHVAVRPGAPPATDRPAPPATDECRYPGGAVLRRLPGIDLLVQPRRGAGLVTLGFHFAGVTPREREATAGISWLLARATLRGAGGLSGEALAEAAERLGGSIVPDVGADALGWWLTLRPDAARAGAALLGLLAAEPTLSAEDVTVERAVQASDARRVWDDMFRHPLQRVLGRAFPAHAYGLPTLGEPEVVAAFEAEQVRAWAGSVRCTRPVAIAVGDLDPDALLAALTPLAAWVGDGAATDRGAAVAWHAGRGEERRRKAQTALAMAFPAAPFGSSDRYALVVLAAVLSGLAGRLFDALRERRSLAYTVAAVPWLARDGGAILTYVATSPPRERETRDAMLVELKCLLADPVSPNELERARRYAAGTVELRRQSGRAVAAELLQAWLNDVLDQAAGAPARLRAVTREELHGVAERVFVAAVRAEYVVRGGE